MLIARDIAPDDVREPIDVETQVLRRAIPPESPASPVSPPASSRRPAPPSSAALPSDSSTAPAVRPLKR